MHNSQVFIITFSAISIAILSFLWIWTSKPVTNILAKSYVLIQVDQRRKNDLEIDY
jgi:hypothetical protein